MNVETDDMIKMQTKDFRIWWTESKWLYEEERREKIFKDNWKGENNEAVR